MEDLLKRKAFLESLAKQAGKIMMANWQKGIRIFQKPDGTPVTEVDLQISQLVCRECAAAYPNDSLITEESPQQVNVLASRGFIIDELDGTSAFIRRKRGFTFQCAYFENHGDLLLGLIYDPLEDRLVYAIKGHGAFISQNGQERRLPVLTTRNWLSLRYANHRQYMTQTLRKMYAKLGVRDQNIIPTGGIGSKSIDFAIGKVDILIALNRKIAAWDWAPGKVILEELGYSVSRLTGETITISPEKGRKGFGYLVCPPNHKDKLLRELAWIVRKMQDREVSGVGREMPVGRGGL